MSFIAPGAINYQIYINALMPAIEITTIHVPGPAARPLSQTGGLPAHQPGLSLLLHLTDLLLDACQAQLPPEQTTDLQGLRTANQWLYDVFVEAGAQPNPVVKAFIKDLFAQQYGIDLSQLCHTKAPEDFNDDSG